MKLTEKRIDEAGDEYDAFTSEGNLLIVIVAALIIAILVSVPVFVRAYADKVDKQLEAIDFGR